MCGAAFVAKTEFRAPVMPVQIKLHVTCGVVDGVGVEAAAFSGKRAAKQASSHGIAM